MRIIAANPKLWLLIFITGIGACGHNHEATYNTPNLMHHLGHSGAVLAVAVDSRGQRMLTGSADRTAVLWDVHSERELFIFRGHQAAISAVALLSDAHTAVTADTSGAVFAWDAFSGRILRSFLGHHGYVRAIAVDERHEQLVTASDDGSVRLWNLASGQERRRYEIAAYSVGISPDGDRIVAGDSEGVIRVYGTSSVVRGPTMHGGKSKKCPNGSIVVRVRFSNDGQSIYGAFLDGRIMRWSLTGGEQSEDWETEVASAIEFTSDCQKVVTGGSPKVEPAAPNMGRVGPAALKVWDLRHDLLPEAFEGSSEMFSSLAVLPDDLGVVGGSWDGSVGIWYFRSLSRSGHRIGRMNGFLTHCVFGEDHSFTVAGCGWRSACVWGSTDQRPFFLRSPGPDFLSVRMLRGPAGEALVLVCSNDCSWLWRPRFERGSRLSFERHTSAWTYDATYDRLFLAGAGGELSWQNINESVIHHLCRVHGDIYQVCFLNQSNRVAAVISGTMVALWDVFRPDAEPKLVDAPGVSNVFERIDGTALALSDSLSGDVTLTRLDGSGISVRLVGHTRRLTGASYDSRHDWLLTTSWDGTARIWDISQRKCLFVVGPHPREVLFADVSLDGQLATTACKDGAVRLWRLSSPTSQSAEITLSEDGEWSVVSPDGRFDTNDLDEVKGLHWVFPDDPFHAIPPEQYLRDYYEPGLLPKLLKGEKLKEVQPLQQLNRARPQINGIKVRQHGDMADVKVTVDPGAYRFEDGKRTDKTAAYDLRLLRDGQLVGRYPLPKDSTPDGTSDTEVRQWRRDTLVTGNAVTFKDVKLPHRLSTQPSDAVEFTAYAFNEDRVKGATSSATTCPALSPDRIQKKAYLVCVGVNDYGSPAWDLHYAAGDAACVAAELAPRLRGFTPVVTTLVTDDLHTTATKDRIHAALQQVAKQATPDDLVLVFFSGHGYDSSSGEFYLLPGSCRPWEEPNWVSPSRSTLDRCVSADELSRWLREVDAGETVLIIDACQSAGAVDRPGFKPGPLGNRGFGQLAYDKRMRVLSASQSDQAANELGGTIGHGVLTYALVHDGLLADPGKSGVERSADGTVSLKQWLEYPTKRVPRIFDDFQNHRLDDFGVKMTCTADPASDGAGGNGTRSAVNLADIGATKKSDATQVPQLFDFLKNERLEVRLAGTE